MVGTMFLGRARLKYPGLQCLKPEITDSPRDLRRDIFDGGKPLIDDHSAMFVVSIGVQAGCSEAFIALCVCSYCLCRQGCASLRLGVGGIQDPSHVVRERELQFPAVVPINLELSPSMERVDREI